MDLAYQYQQVQNNIDHTNGIMTPSLETDSSITIRNGKKELVFIDLKKPLDHVYRPGQELHGESFTKIILLLHCIKLCLLF
jgi:hypothetical protein